MRKVLLATTALVGFAVAGAAQAATSPLAVTVGGDVEFVAAAVHESKAAGAVNPTGGDFETLYSLNFDVAGKATNGIEYGANLVLDNYPTRANGFLGAANGVEVSTADIYMSGAFGKVVLGDSHGATDLAIGAPQVNSLRYLDFLGDNASFAKDLIVGVDGADASTNATYFTPKVGNETHKVQAGISYIPNYMNYGGERVLSQTAAGSYKDMFKGAVAYTGAFKPATVGISATAITADNVNASALREFTAWGIGAQAAAQGFTIGANYTDLGHFNTTIAQRKDQETFGAGVKYEFNKVAVGANYFTGEGYSAYTGGEYVKHFNNYSLSGAYTWAPGLTTSADALMFDQKDDANVKNDGYVLLISQKLAF